MVPLEALSLQGAVYLFQDISLPPYTASRSKCRLKTIGSRWPGTKFDPLEGVKHATTKCTTLAIIINRNWDSLCGTDLLEVGMGWKE